MSEKSVDEKVRERLQDVLPTLPKSVIEPKKLTRTDKMNFRCYPGIGCFTMCCRGIRINLTPYDIYRLKTRLKMTYEQFLDYYTVTASIDGTPLPVTVLRLKDKDSRECPFVTSEGCTVYTDRPVTCRYYPIGMAIMKQYEKPSEEEFYIKILEDHCLGHQEPKEWTMQEWREDQQADLYDGMNDEWLALGVKAKSLGMVEFSKRSLHLFNIASTDMDLFRSFVFESKFLDNYDIEPAIIREIRVDELALLKFAQKWLRFTLFGDGDFKFKNTDVQKQLKAANAKAEAAMKKQ